MIAAPVTIRKAPMFREKNRCAVIREVKVATKPAAILAVLTEEGLAIERIGLEAGPLSYRRKLVTEEIRRRLEFEAR
jgi:hypothetical protein